MNLECIKNLNQFLLMLRSEVFYQGVILDFSNQIISFEQMYELQRAFLSPNLPCNLVLDLSNCHFQSVTWQPFFLAMKCLRKQTSIHLNLSYCNLDGDSLSALFDMMAFALPMKSFTLTLNNQTLETRHIEKLSIILSNSSPDSALILNLKACGINDQMFEALINQLCMNHFFGALTINVASNPLSGHVIYALKTLIESGFAPKTFSLGFSHIPNILTNLEQLVDALNSPQSPPNIQLDLSATQMSLEKLRTLSTLISKPNVIQKLSLTLCQNEFGISEARIIRDAMKTRASKFDRLVLNFGYNQLGNVGSGLVIKSVCDGDASHSFHLVMNNNHLTSRSMHAIAHAITSLACHNHLTLDLSNNALLNENGDARIIFNALKNIHPSKRLSLVLRNCFISDGITHVSRMPMDVYTARIKSDVILNPLAKVLISGTCPQNLELDLSGNTIDIHGVKALALSMSSGNLPQGLIIDLRETDFGPRAAKVIAKAMTSPRMPFYFTLRLDAKQIGVGGIAAFKKSLETLECPLGTRIDVASNRIANYCIENDRIYIARRRLAFVQQSFTQYNSRIAVAHVPGLANAIFSYLYPAKLLAGNPIEIYMRLKETGNIQRPSKQKQISYFEIEPSPKKNRCSIM